MATTTVRRRSNIPVALLITTVAAIYVIVPGCAEQDAGPSPAASAPATHAYRVEFDSVTSIRLEQPHAYPLVQITSIALGADSTIILTDAAEGMLKLYAFDGTLLKVVGGPGRGPGELIAPAMSVVDDGGRIHVMDVATEQISIFDRRGTFITRVQVKGLRSINSFDRLERDQYLIGAYSPETSDVAFIVSQSGEVVTSALPIGDYVPIGQADHPLWLSVRLPIVRHARDTLFAVLTIADSLWTSPTSSMGGVPLPVPSYGAPGLPEITRPDRKRTIAWSGSFPRAGSLIVTPEYIFISYLKGTTADAAPGTGVLRDERGAWIGLIDVPTVLGQLGSTIASMNVSDPNDLVITIWQRKQRHP